MTKNQPWYLTERAQNLAIIFLTENPNVEVMLQQKRDAGLDILVRLREDGKVRGRFFGVTVKATLAQQPEGQVSQSKNFHLTKNEVPFFDDIPFPVCLFLFTVDDDQGYWAWVKQPVIDPVRGPSLQLNDHSDLVKLAPNEMNAIVSDVARWYESVSSRR